MMNTTNIDPELVSAIAQLEAVFGESACLNLDNLEAARDLISSMAVASRSAAPCRPNIESKRLTIHDKELNIDVRLQTYQPKSGNKVQAAILYLHGGGYVVGSADQAETRLSAWSEDLNVLVVSVEYRLAPENPFPAGLFDSLACLKWLSSDASNTNIERIAIVGESAGGGLAAGLSLYVRDHSDIDIALMALLYPMIDHTNFEQVGTADDDYLVWNRANNKFSWQAYLSNSIDREMLPYAAAASATNVSNLPRSYICVGDQDLFFKENQSFAKRLKSAGVDTTLDIYAGGFHGFPEVAPEAMISKRFNKNLFNALQDALCNFG